MIKVFKPVGLAVITASLLVGSANAWQMPFKSATKYVTGAAEKSSLLQRALNVAKGAATSVRNAASSVLSKVDVKKALDIAKTFGYNNRKALAISGAVIALGGYSLHAILSWTRSDLQKLAERMRSDIKFTESSIGSKSITANECMRTAAVLEIKKVSDNHGAFAKLYAAAINAIAAGKKEEARAAIQEMKNILAGLDTEIKNANKAKPAETKKEAKTSEAKPDDKKPAADKKKETK